MAIKGSPMLMDSPQANRRSPSCSCPLTISGQLVDVDRLVLLLLLPDHFVEGFGVEDDGVVEVGSVDGYVDGEVEQGEDDLVEVERLQLVVLANLFGKLCRVHPEICFIVHSFGHHFAYFLYPSRT